MNIMSVWLPLCLACWLSPLLFALLAAVGAIPRHRLAIVATWSFGVSLGLVLATEVLSVLEPQSASLLIWPGWWVVNGQPVNAVWNLGPESRWLLGAQAVAALAVLRITRSELSELASAGGACGAALLGAQGCLQALMLSGTFWQDLTAWTGLTWCLFLVAGSTSSGAEPSLLRTSSARRMLITQFVADVPLWFGVLMMWNFFKTLEYDKLPKVGWNDIDDPDIPLGGAAAHGITDLFTVVFVAVFAMGLLVGVLARVGLFPFGGWLNPAAERGPLRNSLLLAWAGPFSCLAWLAHIHSVVVAVGVGPLHIAALLVVSGAINLFIALFASEPPLRCASVAGLPIGAMFFIEFNGWLPRELVPNEGDNATLTAWIEFWITYPWLVLSVLLIVAAVLLTWLWMRSARVDPVGSAPVPRQRQGLLASFRRLADTQLGLEGLLLLLLSLPVRGLAQLVRFSDWFIVRTLFERLPSWLLRAGAEETMLLERAGGGWPVVIAAGLTSVWLLAWLHGWVV